MNGLSDCPSPDRLRAFASGSLSTAEVDVLATHLERCRACQEALAAEDEATVAAISALRRTVLPTDSWQVNASAARTRLPENEKAFVPAAPEMLRATEAEVRPLLHRRVLALAWLTLFGCVFMLVLQVGRLGDRVTVDARGSLGVAILVLGCLGSLLIITHLRWRPEAPLIQLRQLEVVLIAIVTCYAVSMRVQFLRLANDLSFANGEHRRLYAEHATLLSNLSWYFIIIAYGLFIPNTGRRCSAVVVALSLVALASLGWAGMSVSAIREDLPQLIFVTIFGLSLSSSMAVFGSFRIDRLRRAAVAARQMGQYRLVRRLGVGGMGEVHLAEHALLKRPCAVKLIRPDRARDPQFLERFEREVQSMARLTHPNTVEIYDYGRAEDGSFYYVMEYLEGKTLSELVTSDGPMPPGRAVDLLRQLCGALQEAHDQGLVHRDIKPSNVIVCAQGGQAHVAKLLDFGLVRVEDDGPRDQGLTQEGFVMGTPDFMAPEQALGLPVDTRTDLYSLGAVAYFLLSGRPPFRCDTVLDTLHAHARLPADPLSVIQPDLPPWLTAIVMRCLEKDPRQRFSSAAALGAALTPST